MKRLLPCVVAVLALSACSGATEPRVATTIALSTPSLTFDAVGASQIVTATVTDQHGDPLTGETITWSSSSPSVSVVSAGRDTATVTAVANGTAALTATAGTATGTAVVQVVQAAVAEEKAAGDAQTGAAGAPLSTPLRVKVLDRLGAPVAGVNVTFTVTGGGGSLSSPTVASGADGTAATALTLGKIVATNAVTASISSLVATVTFTASAVAGPAAAIAPVAGDSQSAAVGKAVRVAPAVRVVDAYRNPVRNAEVTFAVTAGGGVLSGSAAISDANGVAAVSSWILGAAGPNTLAATVVGSSAPPAVFTAAAIPAGGAASLTGTAGTSQAARVASPVPTRPAVVVQDAAGNPLAGQPVVFTVSAGGGSVTGAAITTDASGVATVGSWTLGPIATLNTLTATVTGGIFTSNAATFSAAGCADGPASGYAITLCVASTLTTSQRAAFTNAAARWQSVITGDLSPGAISTSGVCGGGGPGLDMLVDDLVIFASIDPIDGPLGTLGQAGWCTRRSGGLPIVGVMEFDIADVPELEAGRQLESVILHEMGHVLGIGTLWTQLSLLQNPSSAGAKLDTYYTGASGIAGFDAVGGIAYTLGRKVPVENDFGRGTYNAHWRESVLQNELMTGFLDPGSNPLSRLTVSSLADLGYTVDPSRADPFFLTLLLRSAPGAAGRPYGNDIYTGPLFTIDPSGRMLRTR